MCVCVCGGGTAEKRWPLEPLRGSANRRRRQRPLAVVDSLIAAMCRVLIEPLETRASADDGEESMSTIFDPARSPRDPPPPHFSLIILSFFSTRLPVRIGAAPSSFPTKTQNQKPKTKKNNNNRAISPVGRNRLRRSETLFVETLALVVVRVSRCHGRPLK